MTTLALLVSFLLLGSLFIGVLSVSFSFLGYRNIGAILGLFSIFIGFFLLFSLPFSPIVSLPNLVMGLVGIGRYFSFIYKN